MPNYLRDGVLKNKLNLADNEDLDKNSAAYIELRLQELRNRDLTDVPLDSAFLKEAHRHLFQDVFEWAGHARNEPVRLSDGSIATEPTIRKADGKQFATGPNIDAGLARLDQRLRNPSYFANLDRSEFLTRAADLFVEINNIHPFREGNGRAQRAFIAAIATKAGYSLDFSVISKERMIQASIAGLENGDCRPMRRLFRDAGTPENVKELKKAISSLETHGFDWNENYIATLVRHEPQELVFAGRSDNQFMARTKDQILIGTTADLPQGVHQIGQHFSIADPGLVEARRLAQAVSWIEPGSQPGAIRYDWADVTNDERDRRQKLLLEHRDVIKPELIDVFRERHSGEFRLWDARGRMPAAAPNRQARIQSLEIGD